MENFNKGFWFSKVQWPWPTLHTEKYSYHFILSPDLSNEDKVLIMVVNRLSNVIIATHYIDLITKSSILIIILTKIDRHVIIFNG